MYEDSLENKFLLGPVNKHHALVVFLSQALQQYKKILLPRSRDASHRKHILC